MTTLRGIILAAALLALSCTFLPAQTPDRGSRAVGASFSPMGTSVIYQHNTSAGAFSAFSLSADTWDMIRGRTRLPGIRVGYAYDFVTLTSARSDGGVFTMYVGPGVTAGYVADYQVKGGVMFGLMMDFGVEYLFPKGISLTVAMAPVLGFHINAGTEDDAFTIMSLYRYGIGDAIFPQVGIKYHFGR